MGELLSEAGEAPEGLLLHLYNGQSPLQAARHNKAHLDKVDAASEQQIAAFQKCIDVLSEALRTVATSAVKDANKDELAKVFAAGGSLFDVNGTLPSGPAKKKKKKYNFFYFICDPKTSSRSSRSPIPPMWPSSAWSATTTQPDLAGRRSRAIRPSRLVRCRASTRPPTTRRTRPSSALSSPYSKSSCTLFPRCSCRPTSKQTASTGSSSSSIFRRTTWQKWSAVSTASTTLLSKHATSGSFGTDPA